MLGFLFRRKPILHDHWYVLIPDFEISTAEFYQSIEDELKRQKIPGLDITEVEFPEGNLMSPNRIYLRLARERLLFEVCAAPFGTSWFFSCRFSEIPLYVRFWELIVMLGALYGLFMAYFLAFGTFWGITVFAVTILGLVYLFNGVVPMGLGQLDSKLVRFPVIGPFYEIFIRRNTYFRQDTRLMYCNIVDQIVRAKVHEFAAVEEVTKVDFQRDESPEGFQVPPFLKKGFNKLWDFLNRQF
jgi:hypothetical protein